MEKLTTRFGQTDYISPAMDFSKYTSYYHKEMGEGLTRLFVTFKELMDRTRLPDIKQATIALEAELAQESKRRVNLDPGYLTLGQLFLASTKDNFQRIYLRDGIYAEVTLYYEQGRYRTFPWTYWDYASEEYHMVFKTIRTDYKKQLRSDTPLSPP